MPDLEKRFPGVKASLAQYSRQVPISDQANSIAEIVQATLKKPLNRALRQSIDEMCSSLKVGSSLTLPGGARLKRLKNGFLIENIDEANSR